ncbi:hypothetical protein RJ639_037387 [Escallonia herrerae]|uniref:C2H2-type domain-containing protein n=1 Tax=Escallonia herrerae TaxID=1293975 RepID=A0AA88WS15_9ASTE|nr:hypothetical protein RJ639_037387 [Escallonia herrerae]
MSTPGKSNPSQPPPAASSSSTAAGAADPRAPLLNLASVRSRMDSVQQFISHSIANNAVIGQDQMDAVSAEIASAIHQVIINGAALLAFAESTNLALRSEQIPPLPPEIAVPEPMADADTNILSTPDLKVEEVDEVMSDDWEIIELDSVELLAEHVHFCDVCGKGFKRDANLRMHMRAHGNQFKTPEALARPEKAAESKRRTRFSCPYVGCNRNKMHGKFRPLKSVICVKNHFKRSHCPKMFSCNRCNKKNFSVVADLKSHLKHCGETKWRCTCGTSFSRKDKLFGHMALFEGHMPAVVGEDEKAKGAVLMVEDEENEDRVVKGVELGRSSSDNGFFEGLLDGFGSIEDFCLQDVLDSPNGVLGTRMNWSL